MTIEQRIEEILSNRKAMIPKVEENLARTKMVQQIAEQLRGCEDSLNKCELNDEMKTLEDVISQAKRLQDLLSSLAKRFDRDYLTLLTFGKAGSGKSRTLITLTGLPESELISRKGNHCTSTIVEVTNSISGERSYLITTYSEEEFLIERILPYFEALDIESKPRSLDAFKIMELPSRENAADVIGSENAQKESQLGSYGHLVDIQRLLPKFEKYLTPRTFPIDPPELASWTTYPSLNGESEDWRCLAVRSTSLQTPVPLQQFRKVRLFDTPGLGSLRVGEMAMLAKYIDDEADALLRIDRPDPLRADYGRIDSNFHDEIQERLTSGIPLWDLLTIVFNKLNVDAPNEEICHLELQHATDRGAPREKLVIADCSDQKELHEKVILPMLDRLVATCPATDSQRLGVLSSKLNECYRDLKKSFSTIRREAKARLEHYDSEELFAEWFEVSQENFRVALYELKHDALRGYSEPDKAFLQDIARITNEAQTTVTVPHSKDIARYQVSARDHEFGGTIDHFIQQLRRQIGDVFGVIRGNMGSEVIRSWQDRFTDAIENTGVLSLTSSTNPQNRLQELTSIFEASGVCPRISTAIRMVSEFRIDYPYFIFSMWRGLERLHPDVYLNEFGLCDAQEPDDAHENSVLEQRRKRLQTDTERCKKLEFLLKREKDDVIKQIADELAIVATLPSELCWALAWDVYDRLILSPEVQREWRMFLRRHKNRLVPKPDKDEQEIFFAIQRIAEVTDNVSERLSTLHLTAE